jgi:hypothetical protein
MSAVKEDFMERKYPEGTTDYGMNGEFLFNSFNASIRFK